MSDYYIAWIRGRAVGFWQADLDDVDRFLADHAQHEVTRHPVAEVAGKTLAQLTIERENASTP